jgi:hypothetical protein
MTDNVDFVRSIYRDWERGEFDSLGWAHAEIEFVVADGPNPMHLRGLRATLQHWRAFLAAWCPSGVVVDEYRELDERRVLVLLHSGRAGAVAAGQEPGGAGAQVFDVRDGVVTALTTYFAREGALNGLGIEE